MSVRRSIVLGLAGAVLLAGCQGEPEPKVEPTSSESSSAIDPSEQPERQTAEEFVRAWVELHTEMQNTGETKRFESVSVGCQPCESFADRIAAISAAGGYVRTDGWRIESLRCTGSSGRKRCDAEVVSAPTTYREQERAKEKHLGGGELSVVFELRRLQGAWNMVNTLERSE
jgi:hypothetical protein